MIDQNWKRWVKISIFKYFITNKGSTFLFLEGESLAKLKNQTQWCELSVTGPSITEPSKDYFKLDVTINALCCVKQNNKIYDLDILTGLYQKLFINSISIYKFGDEPGDDGSLIGCLELKDEIRTTDWGNDSADNPTSRAAIEADYQMKL